MARRNALDSPLFLQIAVAAFFFLLGLLGVLNYHTDLARFGREVVRIFGGRNDTLNIIVSILSLVSGAILLLGIFLSIQARVMYAAGLAIFVYWALRIIYFFFLNDIFEPDFLAWLERLSLDVVVLASVWIVARRYA
jgi:hypothetical protein